MKIKCLEQLKKKLDISEKTFIFLSLFSICYLGGCLVLLVPFFRSLIIMSGEFLIRHPMNHTLWYKKFIIWGISSIVLYVLFFITFFSNNIFSREKYKNKMCIFVMAFAACGIFVIMYQANWTFGDDHEYITTTAINKFLSPFFSGGRFFPLGHFHYNIPLFIFRFLGIDSGLPVEAHFVLIALFFLLSVICLFLLFNRIEPVKGHIHPAFSVFFSCMFFLLGYAFYSIFMNLIFPETQGIMLFSVFMLMYYRALESNKKRYYIAALLAAVYNSYCKEPVFGTFLVVAIVNLFFRYKNQSKKEKIFYVSLIAHGLLFIVLYYLFSYRNSMGFYNEGRTGLQGLQFILPILIRTPLLIIVIVFGLFRFGVIIIKKDREHLYYDSLLFAGIAYIFAYIFLHLNTDYYFLPSIILFLPSLVYWIKYWYQTKKNRALAVFGFIMVICFYNVRAVPDISNKWQEREDFIQYISNLLSEYNEGRQFIWHESDDILAADPFYSSVLNWKKHVENAFLNYRNNSEGKDFFTVLKDVDEIGLYENTLFFIPLATDYESMPENLLKALHDHNFELFTDLYGIVIYKQH
jgi:hypothetical protein